MPISNLYGSSPLLDWDDHSRFRFQGQRPGRISHPELVAELQALSTGPVAVELAGKSVEDRDICCVRAGQGPIHVALWSQMHGNEPTHTVVLVDMLRMFSSATDHPAAELILNRCTLSFLPMLNPDGAARWQRLNAQHIDVNRDARRLASPEARILRDFIRDGSFDYAFNLHNQIPWRTVDGTQLTALSLLVPPLDEVDTVSANVLRAKRLASCLRDAVEPYASGRIARYVAGYMPRCFGEWVQSTGVTTLLVEAGGCPEQDMDLLTQLHFFALVSALLAIAEQRVDQAELAGYQSLPPASDKDRFDLIVRNATRPDHSVSAKVDLGIIRRIAADGRLSSQVLSLGDLEGWSARESIDACGLMVLPGQVAVDCDLRPDHPELGRCLEQAAQQGISTLVGIVDPCDQDQCAAMEQLATSPDLLINVGFLGLVVLPVGHPADGTLIEGIRNAIKLGVLGLLFDGQSNSTGFWQQQRDLLDDLGWFHGYYDELVSGEIAKSKAPSDWCQNTLDLSRSLGLDGRATISQGCADIAVVADDATRVAHLVVDGIPVIRDGVVQEHRAGRLLKRTSS